MRTAAECYPCFLNQMVKTARLTIHDPERLKGSLILIFRRLGNKARRARS